MSVKARIPLRNHEDDIRRWIKEGKSNEWIGSAPGTSASSVQSFRSRRGIYRYTFSRVPDMEDADEYEGALESNEGIGIWLDPDVAEPRNWKERWRTVDAVRVYVTADKIIIVPA